MKAFARTLVDAFHGVTFAVAGVGLAVYHVDLAAVTLISGA
jgi:hypothetical protein